MKLHHEPLWLLVAILVSLPLSGETWYVRKDGGTRYSTKAHDRTVRWQSRAPYHGKGVNQHCAFSDFRYLWDDQTYNSGLGHRRRRHRHHSRRPLARRLGSPQPAKALVNLVPWWRHLGCSNPTIPAGTPTHHTRILGENYATCGTSTATDQSKLTQIFGGFGLGTASTFSGAQYVDMQCIEITRHSNASGSATRPFPSGCSGKTPVDDFDSDGIHTDAEHARRFAARHVDPWASRPRHQRPHRRSCHLPAMRHRLQRWRGWDFDDGRRTPSVQRRLELQLLHHRVERMQSGLSRPRQQSPATARATADTATALALPQALV